VPGRPRLPLLALVVLALSTATAPVASARADAPRDHLDVGVVAGSAVLWELPFVTQLGARSARMEFEIDTPADAMAPAIAAYARAGVRPLLLAGFHGRLPSVAEARNLASWAAAFGPGGTLWRGGSYPARTAVTEIEFGNETSYAYQFPDSAGRSGFSQMPGYVDRARTYALRLRDAHEAVRAANPRVGLLAMADPSGGKTTWVDTLFATVPDLGTRVAGWTVHPYGPPARWRLALDQTIAATRAHRASDSIPLYVTEWGISSDDGRCLDDNFGWDPCMTYDQAAEALRSTLSQWRTRYGSRLRAVYLFQAHDQRASGASGGREGYFGALRLDRTAKGAWTAEVRAQVSGGSPLRRAARSARRSRR
jgi:hypothetical protein